MFRSLMNAIPLGPLALPLDPILLGAAALLAVMAGNRISRTKRFGDAAWMALLIGLASARVAHVLVWWEAYRASPLKILDIRDGGFLAAAGLAAVLAFALVLAWKRPGLARGVWGAFGTGTAAWLVGNIAVAASLAPPMTLPAVSLERLEGGSVSLASFTGRPVVVNLWATWCPPCRREMPAMRAAQEKNPDIVFVFANQREPAIAVDAFLFEQSLTLQNVLLDSGGALAKAAGSRALPTTLFFDKAGKLVDTRLGELSEATLAQRLQRLRE